MRRRAPLRPVVWVAAQICAIEVRAILVYLLSTGEYAPNQIWMCRMRLRTPLAAALCLLSGCTSTSARKTGARIATDTSGKDTATDTAEDTPEDTAFAVLPRADTGIDQLVGVSPERGLCRVTLTCATTIPDEPKLDCQLNIADMDGTVHYDGIAGVEIRGRSSGSAPKHQYGVELRTADGADQSVNLLGMGADADWILNGLYFDRSLMRNALAFDLFRDMHPDRRAADYRYCTLSLNGSPQGMYHLSEKIKRDDDRIDIPVDDGTGSQFLLKLDEYGALHANNLGYGGWTLESPSPSNSTQEAAIRATIDNWEATANTQPADLGDVLDVDAWIDLILLEEFFKNNDAYFLSLFVYTAPTGHLRITPWDLDLSLGQPSYNNNEDPHSWILYRPTLTASLGQIPGFDDRMAARWAELRATVFDRDAIHARLDSYQATMGDGIDENFALWPISSIRFGSYLYPVSSYAEEDQRVRAFIDARLEWMDTAVARWSEGP